jgi:hypothetical protein
MKQSYTSLLLLISLILFAGFISQISQKRKKDKTSTLTSATWTIHEVYMNNKLADNSSTGKRYFKFQKDGSFTYTDEGGPVPGQWSFTPNQKKILLEGGFEATFTIKSINEKEIILIRTFEDNGVKTKAEFRLAPMK